MSANIFDGMDFESLDPNQVNESVKQGGLCPPGLHHAVLIGARDINANSGSSGRELIFKVLAGPGKDTEVKDTVWISNDAKAKNRRVLFMHRLGMLKCDTTKDGKSKYIPIEGKFDFNDCHGAEVIIDVRHEEESWTDKKTGKPRSMMKAILTWEGVIQLNDKRAEKVQRGKVTDQTFPKPPQKNQDEFTDL